MELTFQLQDIRKAAREFLDNTSGYIVFAFHGEMGAGKTTLIKALCHLLGVAGTTSSPTFSIVNEYATDGGQVFHFDFYRLKNQTEALDMGYEEYFYSGNYCFIEWPEKIPDLLPLHYIKVEITEQADHSRQITLTKI